MCADRTTSLPDAKPLSFRLERREALHRDCCAVRDVNDSSDIIAISACTETSYSLYYNVTPVPRGVTYVSGIQGVT
jgi:hypothetical protein